MADGGELPWGDDPPFRAPVFVVTHRPPTLATTGRHELHLRHRRNPQRRRTGALRGRDKNVAIAGGGTLVRQVLAPGLLDQLELHIVPVLLGTGMRLLDADSASAT